MCYLEPKTVKTDRISNFFLLKNRRALKKWSKSVRNGPKGQKWSQNVQYGPKWSSTVPNGPKRFLKKSTINLIGWPFYPCSTWLLYGLKWSKFWLKNHPNGSGITRSPGLVIYISTKMKRSRRIQKIIRPRFGHMVLLLLFLIILLLLLIWKIWERCETCDICNIWEIWEIWWWFMSQFVTIWTCWAEKEVYPYSDWNKTAAQAADADPSPMKLNQKAKATN